MTKHFEFCHQPAEHWVGRLSVIGRLVFDDAIDAPLLSQSQVIETTTIGASSFAVASSSTDDALSVYRVEANGSFTLTDTVQDTELAGLNLNFALGVAIGNVGNKTSVGCGRAINDGISGFELSAAGVLTNVGNIKHAGTSGFVAMTVAVAPGGAYLVADNSSPALLVVYSISADGALTQLNIFDPYIAAGPTQYTNFSDFVTCTLDGATFIIGTASGTRAVAIYSNDDSGSLAYVTSYSAAELNFAAGPTMFSEGRRQYILLRQAT